MLRLRVALRKIAAAALTLSVLSAFAPFSIYSHAHACSMPCCASGSCSTGACPVSFEQPAQTPVPESHCEHGDHEMSEMPDAGELTVRVESFVQEDSAINNELTAHCDAGNLNKLSATLLYKPVPLHQTSVRADAFSRPCGMECCAGVGAFSQVRRSRELALLGHESRPRPPDLRSIFNQTSRPLFLQTQWRRQARPRAPPFIASDFIS
jgi:hypothetical protein